MTQTHGGRSDSTDRPATNNHLPRTITTRRRNAAALDAHIRIWRFRTPVPYSGDNGTELDYLERELAGAAA